MKRDAGAQEIGCVVALSTAAYPGMQQRRLTTGLTATVVAGSGDQGGAARDVYVPGSILEVRHVWQPPATTELESCSRLSHEGTGKTVTPTAAGAQAATAHPGTGNTPPHRISDLNAFVRIKDSDHRLSGWFPVHRVYVKAESALQALGDSGCRRHPATLNAAGAEEASPPVDRCPVDGYTPLAALLRGPWLSSVYEEVTPGMARTQRARRQLDYLEERLLRDCRTPTTIRNFIYLNTYVFRPWYYAPFGLLNSEFHPMLPTWPPRGASSSGLPSGDVTSASPTTDGTAAAAAATPQPYIRDAYLCPFSLRVFSTYAQLHYETRSCRAGRLRPPGEEIYRDEARGLSLFRVNGSQHVTYCRHLFLIGKSFLENKLAGHDVHNYHFYVVCLHHRFFPSYVSDSSAMYFAGFFTWEKHVSEYNLACIATLPCFGRQSTMLRRRPQPATPLPTATPPPPVLRNIGQFMIAASYELAYRRRQVGTPEKPLSDLGAASYQLFWRRALVRWMKATLANMRLSTAVDVDAVASVATEEEEAEERKGEDARTASAGRMGEAADLAAVVAMPRGARSGGRLRKRARGYRDDRASTAKTALPDSSDDDSNSSGGSGSDHGGGDVDHSAGGQRRVEFLSAEQPLRVVSASFSARTTIKEIAAEVRLEEADVLKTLLGMGLLHRSSEDRSIQLLLPQRFVDWMHDEMLRWESSPSNAVFQPELLKSRGRAK